MSKEPQAFLPSPRATNVVLTAGFLGLGYAFWMRYLVIEPSTVGLVCDAGSQTSLCIARRVAIGMSNASGFGLAALVAALLCLLRPHLLLLTIGVLFAAAGVILYNAGLASLAAALLFLSFARPKGPAGPGRG